MPFKSPAQRRFLHAQHPKLAQRWEEKYGSDEVQATRKKRTPKRKGFLSQLSEGYRG